MTRAAATLSLVLALLSDAAPADEAPLRNPFVRPRILQSAEAVAVPDAPAPALELRGVLVAGRASLANVAGRFVRLGEQIDGYRLVLVTEDAATFERGGVTVRIPLQSRMAAALAEELVDVD